MISVGVDVHKRECTVAIQRGDGALKCFGPIENTREGWKGLLQELPPEAEIALEVSTSGYFAMSVLEEAGWGERAHWVHTAGIDSLVPARRTAPDARSEDQEKQRVRGLRPSQGSAGHTLFPHGGNVIQSARKWSALNRRPFGCYTSGTLT